MPASCRERRGQAPASALPRASNGANLCSKAPLSPQVCRHTQAALGGAVTPDGVAVDGLPVTDVYTVTPRARLQATPGGLLGPGRNRLFEGRLRAEVGYAQTTALRLAPTDIGGHHQHLEVTESGALRVRALPLGHAPHGDFLAQAVAQPARGLEWLSALEALLAAEDAAAAARLPPPAAAHERLAWDCPYRRLHYWSGADPAFSVPTPHPGRAAVMFLGAHVRACTACVVVVVVVAVAYTQGGGGGGGRAARARTRCRRPIPCAASACAT